MRLAKLLFVALLAGVAGDAVAAAPFDQPVRTGDGLVQGKALASGVHVFKGIPYAAAPVGALRWREPAPPRAWQGIRAADKFGNVCMQTSPAPVPGQKTRTVEQTLGVPESEDCLYLNVWTAARSPSQRQPVMVWIYGGGYVNGGASNPLTDGESFARDGVVFVSFNYRGGVLGYLVHPELSRESPHHTSGNYGSLDQIAALKWVQKNIAAFGGDPNNVTLFGQSAGAGSINMLQASPLAKGLFSRVIGESTTQLDFNYGGRNGSTGRSFAGAEKLGLQYQSALHAASLKELRSMPASVVSAPGLVKFYPIQGDNYFLPQTVWQSFVSGHQNDVAVIAGSNADEGINLPGKRIFPVTEAEKKTYQALYGADQTRKDQPAFGPAQSIDDALDWQAQKWAGLERKTGSKPSYAYFFSQIPPNAPQGVAPSQRGALHSAEVAYVFDNPASASSRGWTDQDRKLAAMMHGYWLNFARNGDPNGPGLPNWPQYDPAARQMMLFSDSPHAGPAPRPRAWDFLNAYYSRALAAKPN